MKNKIEYILERFLYMTVFATLFIILGYLIPKIYYTYFDKTEYYIIKNPVDTNKNVYTQGENITLYFNRTSLINASATAYIELVLVSEDNQYELYTLTRPLSLDNDPPYQVISTFLQIPDDIPNGDYYVRGTVYFRYRELDKSVNFRTNFFKIENQ